AVDELARDVEQRAAGARPHLPPLAAARQVEAHARARGAARALVALDERAAAVALLDRVGADERAVGLAHLPAPDPEVEVARLGLALARIDARADVPEHALAAAQVPQRVELVRLLAELQRAHAAAIGRG